MNDHHHNPERCKGLFAMLSEYMDNELDGETRRSMDEHLRDCKPCQVCLTTLRRTVAVLRSTDPVPLPKGFSQRLQKLISRYKS
jgi:anti-sigma factor RsiW